MTTATESLSQAQYKSAVADANAILAASPVMSKMLAVRTIALRLTTMADTEIARELQQGWIVEAGPITELLAAASRQRAIQEPGTIEDLQRDVWEIVMPILNVFVTLDRADKENDSNPQSDS